MKIRFGTYGYLDNHLLEMISVSGGYDFFTNDDYIIQKYNFKAKKSLYSNYVSYRLPAKEYTNIRGYNVITFCLYKGVKCQILEVLSNFKFRIGLLEEAMKHFKDFPRHGYDPIYEVTEEEISDIWEERTPIEGFKFEVEPIVYLKKMVSGWWKIDGNVPKLVILQFHQNNKMIINKNKINTPTNINNILPHFYSFCKKLRL